ncbi:hypothetical protein ACFL2T_01060 [Elusimicrobiota bacterium]
MKKGLWGLFLVLSVAGALLSLMFLIVNVSVVPEKLRETQLPSASAADASISDQDLPPVDEGEVTAGESWSGRFLSVLRAGSIDISCISPILLSWFFIAICVNTWRYRSLSANAGDNVLAILDIDTLPLPASHERRWVHWGLCGTLVSLLLAALGLQQGMATGNTVGSVDILMKSFGTALCSTCTAVVLVHMAGPVVQWIWRWLNGIPDLRPATDLESQVRALAHALEETRRQVKELNGQIAALVASTEGLSWEKVRDELKDMFVKLGDLISSEARALKITMEHACRVVMEGLGKIETKLGRIESNTGPIAEEVRGVSAKVQWLSDASEKRGRSLEGKLDTIINGVKAIPAGVGERVTAYVRVAAEALRREWAGLFQATSDRISGLEGKLKGMARQSSLNTANRKMDELKRMTSRRLGSQPSSAGGNGAPHPGVLARVVSRVLKPFRED